MKDVVAEFASTSNLPFIPKRRPDGNAVMSNNRPVYSFGSVPVFFERDLVYARYSHGWTPTSLDDLLAAATGY
eukprot:CAMPEP_0174266160 /NCGR_PEP_ID=MMETSP0439-20130205/29214_1 /TAXON_ID=0 /ORGANISM="Stereomyxa ramosa, Strain Chinc5" /LENGTH=72 /DNA_ID=CAMNT_0015352959 /DNA_START=76 /DNA_END=294 /DNA_ORIENTATION=+